MNYGIPEFRLFSNMQIEIASISVKLKTSEKTQNLNIKQIKTNKRIHLLPSILILQEFHSHSQVIQFVFAWNKVHIIIQNL